MNDPAAPLPRSAPSQARPADPAAPDGAKAADAARTVEDFEDAIRRAAPRGERDAQTLRIAPKGEPGSASRSASRSEPDVASELAARTAHAAKPARAETDDASAPLSNAAETAQGAGALRADPFAGDPFLAALLARLSGQDARAATREAPAPAPCAPAAAAPAPVTSESAPPETAHIAVKPEARQLDAVAPSFEAQAPVGIETLATTRHLPPARLEGAAAALGEAALGARPALLDAPALAPPASMLKLALSPAGLGEIEVTLRLRGGRLEAAIGVDRPETAALVERVRGELSDALRRAGYDVDPAAVATRARPVEPSAPAARADGASSEGPREDGAPGGRERHGAPGGQSQARQDAQQDERRQSWREARQDRSARARRPDFLLGALP